MAQSKPVAPDQGSQLSPEQHWRNEVQNWYRDLFSTTHCIPPVYFNREGYITECLAGRDLFVQTPPSGAAAQTGREMSMVQKSDVRDDFAQGHILECLKALGRSREPEAIFLISNLKFRNFLKTQAPIQQMPQGDFDIVLIHSKYGILIGEIKSVGHASVTMTQSEADEAVRERLNKAILQLQGREDTAMKLMIQGVEPRLTVKKTVMLPYVSRAQLQRVLQNRLQKTLAKKLRLCLCAKDTREATQLCLCSDDLSDPSNPTAISGVVLAKLDAWFVGRMGQAADPLMTNDLYLDLIARFGGPATVIDIPCITGPRLQVHTIPEAVSEVGERFARIVLTPEQFELLNLAPKNAWLSGPPGTGKTIALVVQGMVWLKQGHDVHVLCCNFYSWHVAHMIYSQLKHFADADSSGSIGTPHNRMYDFHTNEDDAETALNLFKTCAASGRKVCILADECNYERENADRYQRFFRELNTSVQDICIWATSLGKTGTPDVMERFDMTKSLRCPPVVARQVKPGVDWFSSTLQLCDSYVESSCPAPCEGMPIIWLTHAGSGHSGQWPAECEQCGVDVANKLRELGVGFTGNPVSADRPPRLRYLDVMVITRSSLDAATGPSTAGDQSTDCGFVVGMRTEAIPVRVLPNTVRVRPELDDVVREFATASADVVTVVHPLLVQGLERKVVVVLPGRGPNTECDDVEWTKRDRLDTASRCTSQLIVVQCPGHPFHETAV